MSERIHAPHVGAPDPDRRTSPVLGESDENYEEQGQLMDELPLCHFNDVSYSEGSFVCSGDELLCCRSGAWVRLGSCDPANP